MKLPGGHLDSMQAMYFSRVMCTLLQRKPYESLDFVRAQGNVVPLFLEHLGVSAVVDLLLKVISLEELDNGPGIIGWLSEDHLIPMLVDRLSPQCDPEMHSLAAQVLLDIIAISQCNTPSQPTIGINALIEELKSEATVTRLVDYMLDRSGPHATSTLINCVYIFIELIRRNYSEDEVDASPDEQGNGYGFGGSYDGSSYEQQSPRRLPTVDLSDMMRVLALRVNDLVDLLKNPRSSTEPVPTTLGLREPLGFERLRICELFAELLHCSNMPRLNQSVGSASDDAVFVDASAGTDTGAVTADASASVPKSEKADKADAENTPSHKDSPTVVGFAPHRDRGSPGSASSSPSSKKQQQQTFSPGSARSGSSSNSGSNANLQQLVSAGGSADGDGSDSTGFGGIPLEISTPSAHDTANTPVGQLLKWKLIQHEVLPICTDLFFRFSLNNFLHSVVYDIMHQVLNLPLNLECNLALIVVAFRDVRITSRIAQACAHNDQVSREPRGVRLGYMGHLTGIGEEVARLLELSGAALEPLIAPFIDGDEWLDYVARTLQEVRERDQQPLGGERPGGANSDMSGDNANQVFVSRMGLVDPSSNESYGAHDGDDDDDEGDDEYIDEDMEDDMDEDMDDEVQRYTRRSKTFGSTSSSLSASSAGQATSMLYPANDEDEDSSEYMSAHQNMYFAGRGASSNQFGMGPMVSDDADQFIIKDDDDDDDDAGVPDEHDLGGADDAGIGPAGRIGRFRSYQNEPAAAAAAASGFSDDEDEDIAAYVSKGNDQGATAMDEDPKDGKGSRSNHNDEDGDDNDDDEDEDGASEVGRMRDYMRNRAADMAEATRLQKSQSPPANSASAGSSSNDDQGKGGSSLLLFTDCADTAIANGPNDDDDDDDVDNDDNANQNICQEDNGNSASSVATRERRQLVRLSFDGSAHTVSAIDQLEDASVPSYLLALPSLSSPPSGTFSFNSPKDANAPSSSSFSFSAKPTSSYSSHAAAPTASPAPPSRSLNSKPPNGTIDDDADCADADADADAETQTESETDSDNSQGSKLQSLPQVPSVPPHPFADILASMPPPPPIPPHPFAPSLSSSPQQQAPAPPLPKTRPKNPFIEPKGRLQDLYRESKQRSRSSSELDNIVPADIGSWSSTNASGSAANAHSQARVNGSGALGEAGSGSVEASGASSAADQPDDDGASARRGRTGSFAARRQRSRSQSAGVGITREMVIQAASKGQFPYLDAKTCEFVGQLKTDTVTLGGAAAGGNREAAPRQRSKTAVGGGGGGNSNSSNSGGAGGGAGAGIGIGIGINIGKGPRKQSGSAPTSAASSPTVKPAIHLREGLAGSPQQPSGLRVVSGLAQSGLRSFPSDMLSDSDDDDELDLSGMSLDDDAETRADSTASIVAGGSVDDGQKPTATVPSVKHPLPGQNPGSYMPTPPPSSSTSVVLKPVSLASSGAVAATGAVLAKTYAKSQQQQQQQQQQQHHHPIMQSVDSRNKTATSSSCSATNGGVLLPSALTIPSGNQLPLATSGTANQNGNGRQSSWRRDNGGGSGNGGRRNRRGGKSSARAVPALPGFPTLPMSPVHKSSPIMFDSSIGSPKTSTSPK
ncbi:sporulation-induced protein [Coemansia sp. RSA 486]|nr:sporulation-induced protein [Coemansia sp. RSA 486]